MELRATFSLELCKVVLGEAINGLRGNCLEQSRVYWLSWACKSIEFFPGVRGRSNEFKGIFLTLENEKTALFFNQRNNYLDGFLP